MATSSVMAAGKIDLKSVTDGTFAAKRISGIDPLKGTDQYAQISQDGKQIVQYSFRTGKQTAVLFDVSNTVGEKIDAFDGYILSPDGKRMLADEAVSDGAKEAAMQLKPSTEKAEVRRRLDETTAAKSMMVVNGSPSFSGIKDVRPSLSRADLGGTLNTRELLDIARVLQCSRLVRAYVSGDRHEKTCIDFLFTALRANKFLEEKISSSIIGEDEIADGASSELSNIRRKIRAYRTRGSGKQP